jgi:hypothetical protein
LPTSIRTKTFEYIISNDISITEIALEIFLTLLFVSALSVISFLSAYCYLQTQPRSSATSVSPMEVDNLQDQAAQDMTDQTDHAGPATTDNKKRTKGPKYVSELCKKSEHDKADNKATLIKSMFQKSDLYIWLVLMMGIFYGIPAIQLVLKYQDMLTSTGNNDLCYYNFLCSVPLNKVQDFNHVLSNIGYMASGLTFVAIVKYRKKK